MGSKATWDPGPRGTRGHVGPGAMWDPGHVGHRANIVLGPRWPQLQKFGALALPEKVEAWPEKLGAMPQTQKQGSNPSSQAPGHRARPKPIGPLWARPRPISPQGLGFSEAKIRGGLLAGSSRNLIEASNTDMNSKMHDSRNNNPGTGQQIEELGP